MPVLDNNHIFSRRQELAWRIHFLYLPKINENRLKVDINFGVYLLIYCHFLLIGFRLKKMANKR